MKLKYITIIQLTLTISLFSQSIFAKNTRGMGGDAVVCFNQDQQIETVTLLDYFQATRQSQTIDLGSPDLNYKEKVNYVLKRLEKINPTRAHLYKLWWKTFEKNTLRLKGYQLPDTKEPYGIKLPNNCKLKPVASQGMVLFPGERYYTFDQDLIDKMDSDNHAGLILHSLILKEALLIHRHSNSIHAQELNRVISSSRLDQIHLQEYFGHISKTHFVYADAHGIAICVPTAFQANWGKSCSKADMRFHDANSLASAYTYDYKENHPHPDLFSYKISNYPNSSVYPVGQQYVSFYPSQQVEKLQISNLEGFHYDRENNQINFIDEKIKLSFYLSDRRGFSKKRDMTLVFESNGQISALMSEKYEYYDDDEDLIRGCNHFLTLSQGDLKITLDYASELYLLNKAHQLDSRFICDLVPYVSGALELVEKPDDKNWNVQLYTHYLNSGNTILHDGTMTFITPYYLTNPIEDAYFNKVPVRSLVVDNQEVTYLKLPSNTGVFIPSQNKLVFIEEISSFYEGGTFKTVQLSKPQVLLSESGDKLLFPANKVLSLNHLGRVIVQN